MVRNAIDLEEKRLKNINSIDEYDMVHERHRIFPEIFEDRNHKKIIDLSAGVGIIGKRIREHYDCELLCNDISPKCLAILAKNGLKTASFDLDDSKPFPLKDDSFDAAVSLSTIEHLVHVDFFVKEVHRILKDDGCFYLSAPNYNGLLYILRLIATGKTFHDPLNERQKYEFYGHIRYFTYRSLKEFVNQYGFQLESVYIPLPKESTRFKRIQAKSKIGAFCLRFIMNVLYHILSARWAPEPVLCLRKTVRKIKKAKKVVL